MLRGDAALEHLSHQLGAQFSASVVREQTNETASLAAQLSVPGRLASRA